jgi:hypothetical protein
MVPGVSQAAKAAGDKTMWCDVPNEQLYQLCQNEQLRKGLTPAQRKAMDKEWKMRLSSMPPAEAEKFQRTMWCNVPNEQLYQLCQDQQFMGSLTADQKKALDKEWQRRVPSMTPADVQKYYPAGRRYYSGG